jgi:aminocarboxymuconate-semialdehyde decarboxylase
VIFGRVLERWPALRFCFAHGGGAFAYILPRLDKGWEAVADAHAAIGQPPSAYARRVWVDSLTLHPRVMAFALETFGPERVVLGSDYPFKMGVDDPVAALEPLHLDAAVRRRLLVDNAREFLGLGPA